MPSTRKICGTVNRHSASGRVKMRDTAGMRVNSIATARAPINPTGSNGTSFVGSNRYTSASASNTLANAQTPQRIANALATRVALPRPKPAVRAPRQSMTQIVTVVPIKPASTIAQTYIGSALMDLSVAWYLNDEYVYEHRVQCKWCADNSVNNQRRRNVRYRT